MAFHPTQSLTEQIADHLSKEIITGQMPAGERIQELRIAKTLQVSRGSVREALLVLAGRHLIDLLPRRGAIVRSLDPDAVIHISELSAGLTSLLLQRTARAARTVQVDAITACDRHVQQLQDQLQEASGYGFMQALYGLFSALLPLPRDAYLEETLGNLLPAAQRVTYKALQNPRYNRSETLDFVQALRTALSSQDTDALASLVLAHYKREAELARY